ncbi:tryptophan 2,3-dioxygenase family protein [Catenuloplanes atrovinosus]|uniref:Tryptophan 2,3-dioxygenase n=1 Tax=Catenuloplanes atrovinosus TaxID=137266 RepID=A0AAE4C8D9_9ACTN|nr:tryptophan 2,3-dioxygenase family protein [Catenuloplanes atrovinosus]MDR7275426.1 tryptophan 2,3-dioxygenase [Catenuloplanes atrovinosus]
MSAEVAAVRTWAAGGGEFPYATVLSAYRRWGKALVPSGLLDALSEARRRAGGDLRPFLDVLLDKRDGTYDYRSYLALPLLAPHLAESDVVIALLVADLVRFELAADDDPAGPLPVMPPDDVLVEKRLRHGLRVIRPVLDRLDRPVRPAEPGVRAEARAVWAAVEARMSGEQRLLLRCTMLPVDIVHDEYLFIRVLQTFETAFAGLVRDLDSAATALSGQSATRAEDALRHAAASLREVSPLWSILATMRVGAFRRFRQWTEGASAIQSRHYKLMESLARRPDEARLGSAAYDHVPEIRTLVRTGLPSVDAAFRAATLAPGERAGVAGAMAEFAAAVDTWRRTHHRLATRMLGAQTGGTGYTGGVSYLAGAREIPVFG